LGCLSSNWQAVLRKWCSPESWRVSLKTPLKTMVGTYEIFASPVRAPFWTNSFSASPFVMQSSIESHEIPSSSAHCQDCDQDRLKEICIYLFQEIVVAGVAARHRAVNKLHRVLHIYRNGASLDLVAVALFGTVLASEVKGPVRVVGDLDFN
jgi:hypothetical protein